MSDAPAPRVSRAAWALGLAGLLPQAAAVAFVAGAGQDVNFGYPFGELVALYYASLILSFLGGIWWGFAMRRASMQGALAALAVLPSLAAAAILLAGLVGLPYRWQLLLLGVAILLTMRVDWELAVTGEAPDGWWTLRATLSTGLGLLTIAAGLLAP